MQNLVTASDCFGPAMVGRKVRGDEGELLPRLQAAHLQHGAHCRLAPHIPDRRTDLMAPGQELQDAVAAYEAGPSGYKDCAHG